MEIIQDQDQITPWQVGENVSIHLSLGLDSREGKILHYLKKDKCICKGRIFLRICLPFPYGPESFHKACFICGKILN